MGTLTQIIQGDEQLPFMESIGIRTFQDQAQKCQLGWDDHDDVSSDAGGCREHLLAVSLLAKFQGKGRYSFLLFFADKVTWAGEGHPASPKSPSE